METSRLWLDEEKSLLRRSWGALHSRQRRMRSILCALGATHIVKPEAIAKWLWVKYLRSFIGPVKGIEEMFFEKDQIVG